MSLVQSLSSFLFPNILSKRKIKNKRLKLSLRCEKCKVCNECVECKECKECIETKYSEESISFQDELVHKLNETKTNLDEELKKFIRQNHEYVKELQEKAKAYEVH